MRKKIAGKIRLGALSIVAILLIGSASVRLASGTGAAIAREVQNGAAERPEPPQSFQALEEAALRAMLDDLNARDEALTEREARIKDRMAELERNEMQITEQLLRLEAAEDSLRATLALAEGASEADLTQLTAVYENMKPKEAAELFEEMAPEFAAGFIGRMRPEAAAGILAGLNPDTAYSISAVMAGRHMDVPTQ